MRGRPTYFDYSMARAYCAYSKCGWGLFEHFYSRLSVGWSGGAMVLGKLPVPGRPTILITVGQGPTALAVGAGGGGLDIFTLIYPFSSLSLSLGDGPIWTEILSQRAVKPKTTNQTKIVYQFSFFLPLSGRLPDID